MEDVPKALSRPAWKSIPAGVWTLGFVSLLMDTSSELIHSLLPLFLVTTLGASTLTVGFIEGIAEATALITKLKTFMPAMMKFAPTPLPVSGAIALGRSQAADGLRAAGASRSSAVRRIDSKR